jgi:hypothetical protein
MADIAPQGFVNYGLSQAQQGQAQASAGLVNQQAQGAAIQNSMQTLAYQVRRNAIMNFTGQGGGADFSGGGVGSSASSLGPQQGTDDNSASNTSGADQIDYGESAFHPGRLESLLRGQYFVNPAGTPQEQQMIAQGALSGDEGLLKAATARRDMNVASRTYTSQQYASRNYETMAAVESAPAGLAWDSLESVSPATAKQILKEHPQDTREADDAYSARLDELARDTAAHAAGVLHQYTGRELKQREGDNAFVDKITGMPVPVPHPGLSTQQYAELFKQANMLVEVPLSDGTTAKVPQYAAALVAGGMTPEQAMKKTSAAAWVNQSVDQQTVRATMPSHPAFAGTPMERPGNTTPTFADGQSALAHHGFNPAIGQPPAGQPGQAPPQPGQAPGQPPTGQPGPGQARPQADNGLLPGVDVSSFPRTLTPSVVAGRTQTPQDASNIKNTEDERYAQLKEASTQVANIQTESALIRRAQNEAANINPRMVGPGSEIAQTIAKVRKTVTGGAPDDLADLGELEKTLTNMGVTNIRTALSGQRITNQEMMTLLGKANPSTEQPKETMQRILNFMGANNDYEGRANKTRIAALRSGADPYQINSTIAAKADKSDFLQRRTGVTPSQRSGNAAGATADSGGFIPGKQYRDKAGNTATYLGNGKWQ